MALHLTNQHDAIAIWLVGVKDQQNGPLTLKNQHSFAQAVRYHAAKAWLQQLDKLLLREGVGVGHQGRWQGCAHTLHSLRWSLFGSFAPGITPHAQLEQPVGK